MIFFSTWKAFSLNVIALNQTCVLTLYNQNLNLQTFLGKIRNHKIIKYQIKISCPGRSSMKLSFLDHWVLGASAIPFFIQAKLGFSGRAPVFKIYTNPVKLKQA